MNRTHSGAGRALRAGLAMALAVFTLFMMTQGTIAKGAGANQPQQTTQPVRQNGCQSSFTVSPGAGPIGTKLTISGSRWPTGEQVGVYFVDSARQLHPFNLGSPQVLSNGSWKMTIAVPATVIFSPVGDEGTGAPVTQKVTTGNYLIYAATGDPNGFSINQVCPAKFTITAGPVAGSDAASTPSNGTNLWVDIGLGALILALLAIVAVIIIRRWYRRWDRRKIGAGLAAIALVITVSGVLLTASALSARSVSASPAVPAVGTVLYSDDFESDTVGSLPAGWTIETGTTWTVQVDGSNVLEQTSSSNTPLYGIYAGDPTWTDYSLSASVKPGPGSTSYSTSVVAIDGRRQDANNFYTLLVKNGNAWYLGKKVSGNFTTLASGSTSYNTTTWYTWTLTMTGTTISASINGTTLATVTDSAFASGNIGFKTHNQSEYDTIVVTSTGSNPTPTPTPTNTPTPTATNTPTPTPTATDTPTPTPTTNTPTPTPTATNTPTPTPTDTPTPTPTATNTPTPTPTATNTPTPTPTATNTPTPTPTGTPTGIGSISGQVTDPSSAPIAGAQISTLPTTITTTTDSNGNYTLANIPAGTYAVIATVSGYNETYVSNITVTDSTTTTANETFTTPIPAYTGMDTYFQPDQNGWNPSTDGNTWLDDSARYPGATVNVTNNQGYSDTYTAAVDRDEWMGASSADQLVSADFEVLQFAQDAFQHGARLLSRVTDGHHFIVFAINYATSTLQLWVNNNENWTLMKQVSVPAFQTGQWYHAQLITVGTKSYGKVWAFGTAEPTWMLGGSQTVLTTGMGGTRSTFAKIFWDNFSVQSVTTITGKVSTSSGTGIAGATVTDGTNTTTTESGGFYVLIEPNTSATYTVTASATSRNSQSQSVTTTNQTHVTVNFTLT